MPTLHFLTWGFEGKKGIYIVFIDRSAKKTVRPDKPTRYRSWSSYLILKQSLENNRHVKHATLASGKATSYNAEVMALAASIKNAIRAGSADLHKLHIFADNQTALQNIVEPGCYSGQMFTLLVIKNLQRFLCESPEHSITLHWCPAHVGIPQNKFIDQLAKSRKDAPLTTGHLRLPPRCQWQTCTKPSVLRRAIWKKAGYARPAASHSHTWQRAH